jgi:NADPH2:quinone reductase
VQAASLPENYFTVWSNVFDRARLTRGESLLVQGGSSGIGVTAIQLAHALGSRVYATAGSPEKCAACERLGADRAINYRTEDFVEVAKAATGGRGVDVVLDMVGGAYVPRELAVLADEGRLVLISTLGGTKTEIDLRAVMGKRLSITGSMLRSRPPEFKGGIARSLRDRVWPLLESGAVAPVIYATFPLEHASDAHRLMESSEHIGKIVLTLLESGQP